MKLHEHLIFWLDSQICMGDAALFYNLRNLGGLPLVPCIVIAAVWFDTFEGRTAAIIAGLALCVPWAWLIIHRYRKKKETWVEPSRFSDRGADF